MKWLKEIWEIFQEQDGHDPSKEHLTQADKHHIWYGSLIICLSTLALSTLADGIGTIIANNRSQKQTDEIINTVVAYLSTATNDEYEEIMEQLRHDLIITRHQNDIKELLQYTPNTTENCPTCMKSHPAQAYIISANTGMLYSLDLYEKGDTPLDEYTGVSTNFGYDEISQTNIRVTREYADNHVTATLNCGRGIVSVHRMKRLFCDNCIDSILDATKDQLMDEFFLFDTEYKAFYPIDSGTTVQIWDYMLEIEYKNNSYEIEID